MTALMIWCGAAVLFGLCVILLLRAEAQIDAEGNQVGNIRRTRRIALLGMLLAGALVALGFFGTRWWQ